MIFVFSSTIRHTGINREDRLQSSWRMMDIGTEDDSRLLEIHMGRDLPA